MNVYDETLSLTKLIFNEIYAREFPDRKSFDSFVMDLIRKSKQPDTEYTYVSLYLSNNFTFHINVVNNKCYSVTTFNFSMVWNDFGFLSQSNMDNVSTFIGTPAYWFGRNEQTDIVMNIIDEIRTKL